ncbi:MAG: 1-acyl-sn-glycerol-3-phosphate acyltransferase [Bacteroidota bacterium]
MNSFVQILMAPVGVLRLLLLATIILVGGLAMVLLAPIPLRVRGIRLGAWPQVAMARTALLMGNVWVRCDDRKALRHHQGLVFPNHLSFVDIAVLLSIVPVRFMATQGVAKLPVIGWLATMIGTVYVNRGSDRGRAQARREAGEALKREPYPPLAIFAEGGIGPGDQVLPLRHGAFGLAAEHGLGICPVAIAYDPLAVARWEKPTPLWRVVWRIATFPGPLRVRVTPLPELRPTQDEDLPKLATDTQQALAHTLGVRAGTVRHEDLRKQVGAWALSDSSERKNGANESASDGSASGEQATPASVPNADSIAASAP